MMQTLFTLTIEVALAMATVAVTTAVGFLVLQLVVRRMARHLRPAGQPSSPRAA